MTDHQVIVFLFVVTGASILMNYLLLYTVYKLKKSEDTTDYSRILIESSLNEERAEKLQEVYRRKQLELTAAKSKLEWADSRLKVMGIENEQLLTEVKELREKTSEYRATLLSFHK